MRPGFELLDFARELLVQRIGIRVRGRVPDLAEQVQEDRGGFLERIEIIALDVELLVQNRLRVDEVLALFLEEFLEFRDSILFHERHSFL